MQQEPIRIGTRGSALALAQTEAVRRQLIEAHGLDPQAVTVEIITTSGDTAKNATLREIGGKGLFTKEIEEALLAERIDLAVHSLKDMETELPHGLAIACLPPREDPRDAFLSPRAAALMDLPEGASLGTSSLRRQAQVKRLRPDLAVAPYRGNVDTRLRKLEQGDVDATLLAYAGLKRLGLAERVTALMEPDAMLPAVGQGAVAIETRARDERLAALLAPLHDDATATCIAAERAFLARLDGSCRTPIAGLAELSGERLRLRGMILSPDGAICHATERNGAATDATAMGEDAARELLAEAGPEFLASLA